MSFENVPRCQHVKINGTQCGSPALRRRRHCFFHERIRRERAKIAADTSARRGFDLPLLQDANSVQVALMKTIQMLGSGRLDHRTAGLILYALQTASVNLRNAEFEVRRVTDVVIDRDDVDRTCINGPQWYEEDFGDEVEEGGEVEGEAEADDEAAVAAGKVAAAAAPRKIVRQVSLEEARMRVQGVVPKLVIGEREREGSSEAGLKLIWLGTRYKVLGTI